MGIGSFHYTNTVRNVDPLLPLIGSSLRRHASQKPQFQLVPSRGVRRTPLNGSLQGLSDLGRRHGHFVMHDQWSSS